MQLYKQTCLDCSKVITQNYSTSFTLGIKTLHKKFHFPIYAIYGFVRYADEIVDTFHGFDKKLLLDKFRADTYEAIESGISLNPVLHSFQSVVNEYNIDHALIDAFLYSMEMDLQKKEYSQDLYETYIYGSAEVVGLMCLYVFCGGDQAEYDRLKAPAQSLGKAFQKVNFLRDMKDDHEERGRVYFPGVDFHEFNLEEKIKIEADIQADFDHAYSGIVELPEGARRGVYLAYRYYLKLFHKITKLPPARILKERIRVPDKQKLLILVRTYLERQMKPAPTAIS
ncbi:MAG: phytoene/squalene synthase family protein [Bacteroidota bacterium]